MIRFWNVNATQPPVIPPLSEPTNGTVLPSYRPVWRPSAALVPWAEVFYEPCCGDPGDCNEACQ